MIEKDRARLIAELSFPSGSRLALYLPQTRRKHKIVSLLDAGIRTRKAAVEISTAASGLIEVLVTPFPTSPELVDRLLMLHTDGGRVGNSQSLRA